VLTTGAVGRDGEAMIAPAVPEAFRRDDGCKPGGGRRPRGGGDHRLGLGPPNEGGAPARLALDVDRAAVGLDEGGDDGEAGTGPAATPGAAGFAAPEGIREVPVSRVEDLDSRGDIRRTIVEDSKGLWRMRLGRRRSPSRLRSGMRGAATCHPPCPTRRPVGSHRRPQSGAGTPVARSRSRFAAAAGRGAGAATSLFRNG